MKIFKVCLGFMLMISAFTFSYNVFASKIWHVTIGNTKATWVITYVGGYLYKFTVVESTDPDQIGQEGEEWNCLQNRYEACASLAWYINRNPTSENSVISSYRGKVIKNSEINGNAWYQYYDMHYVKYPWHATITSEKKQNK